MKFEIITKSKYVLVTENDNIEFNTLEDVFRAIHARLRGVSSGNVNERVFASGCDWIEGLKTTSPNVNKRGRGETKAKVFEYVKEQIIKGEQYGWSGAAQYAGITRATAQYHLDSLKNEIEEFITENDKTNTDEEIDTSESTGKKKAKECLLVDPEDGYRPILNTNTRTNYDGNKVEGNL